MGLMIHDEASHRLMNEEKIKNLSSWHCVSVFEAGKTFKPSKIFSSLKLKLELTKLVVATDNG